jgi:hypothetical protein
MTETNTEKKVYQLIESDPTAIVIHCSDPRFQKAFKEFINNELGLKDGDYIPLVISGGAGSLSEPLKLPKEFKFMKERIEYFVKRFDSIKRIVLINHEDCKYYESMKNYLGNSFLNRVANLIERQKVDLKSVAKNLLSFFGSRIQGELYYAHFADEKKQSVTFEKIFS